MDNIDLAAVKMSKREYVDELNARAIAANLAELREHYDGRITSLENEVASLRTLVQDQSRVVGETLARLYGHGSTERGE